MALPTITAIGNLTFDPDFQVTTNGISRCRLRIACNERKKQDGEWVDGEPTFLDVTLWRGLAEAAGDNFKKGQAIMVTGKLKVRNYEDKNGVKATAVEIEATDIAAVVKPAKSAAAAPTEDPWIQVMNMDVAALILLTIMMTLGSMYVGYRLAIYRQEMKDIKWLSEMSYEDLMSDAPIYNKLSREYGYFN